MSKLTDFYTHKATLKEKGQTIEPQWAQLENQLLREELLPELLEQLKIVFSKVKSPLMFSGTYDPSGFLSVSFTRNCIQTSMMSPFLARSKNAQETMVVEEETQVDSVSESEENKDEETTTPEFPKYAKAKSIGFSVSFRDGTVYHEKKAVNTWILTLKKIGLENICNNRSKHQAWHKVAGRDICIVERTETIRESDGKSPQTFVDGFYVLTQLSNEQKEKDLLALSEFMPKLGIKIKWDNDPENEDIKEIRHPVIDEEAALYNLPLEMQFHEFLRRTKTEGTAKSYTSTLDNAVRKWVNMEVDANANSIFSYTTAEDVRLCIEMLNSSTAFVEENVRKHHAMSAALNQYLVFIEEREKRINN